MTMTILSLMTLTKLLGSLMTQTCFSLLTVTYLYSLIS
jgi:hypothetical protein